MEYYWEVEYLDEEQEENVKFFTATAAEMAAEVEALYALGARKIEITLLRGWK